MGLVRSFRQVLCGSRMSKSLEEDAVLELLVEQVLLACFPDVCPGIFLPRAPLSVLCISTAILTSPLSLPVHALGMNNKETIDGDRRCVPLANPRSCAIHLRLTVWH